MRLQTISLTTGVLCILGLSLAAACGPTSEGGISSTSTVNPSASEVSLETSCSDVVPMRLCVAVRADGGEIAASGQAVVTIDGKVGAAIILGGALHFMVPEGVVGVVRVRAQLDAMTVGVLDLTVGAAPAVDAEAQIATFRETFVSVLDVVQGFTETDEGDDVKELAAVLAESRATFDQKLDELMGTAEGKSAIAAYVAANQTELQALADATKHLYAPPPIGYASTARFVVGTVVLAVKAIALVCALVVGGTALTVLTVVQVAALTTMAVVVKVARVAARIAAKRISKIEFIPTGLDQQILNAGPTQFKSGVPQPINLKLTLRNLQSTDTNSAADWVADVVRAIQQLADICSVLAPEEEPLELAPESTSKKAVDDLGALSVHVKSGAATAWLKGSAAAPKLQFDTTTGKEVVTYTFEYEDAGYTVETPLETTTVLDCAVEPVVSECEPHCGLGYKNCDGSALCWGEDTDCSTITECGGEVWACEASGNPTCANGVFDCNYPCSPDTPGWCDMGEDAGSCWTPGTDCSTLTWCENQMTWYACMVGYQFTGCDMVGCIPLE